MPTLLVYAGRASAEWRDRFAAAAPEFTWRAWPAAGETNIDALVGWNPPPGLFAGLPSLRLVFALGAGVDGFLRRDDLPEAVPLVRLLDAGMAEQMVEYVLLGVLAWQRRLPLYAAQQRQARWKAWPARRRDETRVGVLGLGRMGAAVAQALAGFGYRVGGWSRQPRELEHVHCRHGEQGLAELLAASDVLVSLLPSTPATRGLLDAARLATLPEGAYLINCARGDQLDAEALCALLDRGHLSGALLDVFASEPLPPDNPLWRHPAITVTPHVAAQTVPDPSVEQIVTNLRRWQRGEAMSGVVDRRRGY